MKMPVLLCDDDPIQLAAYQQIVKKKIIINDYPMDIVLATSKLEEILTYLEAMGSQQALFILDIDLQDQLSGIDLAKKIREKSPLSQIVFLTSHEEMAFETLKRKIAALDFIVKGEAVEKQLTDVLAEADRLFQFEFQQKQKFFLFSIGKRAYKIPIDDLYFIENSVSPHRVNLYGKEMMYEFYDTLNRIEQDYPELTRVHKSFLINLQNVTSIDFKKREIYFPEEYLCTFPVIKTGFLKKKIRENAQ